MPLPGPAHCIDRRRGVLATGLFDLAGALSWTKSDQVGRGAWVKTNSCGKNMEKHVKIISISVIMVHSMVNSMVNNGEFWLIMVNNWNNVGKTMP